MPRKLRIYLPDMPYHVVTRGNNREPCFFHYDDYDFYLECLADALSRYDVQLHAYVLMTNHVHLLMTAVDSTGISDVMQSIGRRYVQYINKTYRRCGTLFEGRHKSSLVSDDRYVLACYRYIELNPVKARMVNKANDYKWSSYCFNAEGVVSRVSQFVSPQLCYAQLGASAAERQLAYKELFEQDICVKMNNDIAASIMMNKPLGNKRFDTQIESALRKREE